MSMFPVICVEHFFPDPQKIIDYAESLEYSPAEAHQYPGVRSDTLFNIDQDLDRYVGNRILRNYYHSTNWSNYNNVNWSAEIRFHKIRPLHKDQYHLKNRGWVHNDSTILLAGLIYLNRVPEPDTGTTLYTMKKGYAWTEDEHIQIEHKHYAGESILDEDFEKAYNAVNNQYDVSVEFKNVFNRMIAYDSQVPHCAQTYGTQERLTLTFFFKDLVGSQPPLSRFG